MKYSCKIDVKAQDIIEGDSIEEEQGKWKEFAGWIQRW